MALCRLETALNRLVVVSLETGFTITTNFTNADGLGAFTFNLYAVLGNYVILYANIHITSIHRSN